MAWGNVFKLLNQVGAVGAVLGAAYLAWNHKYDQAAYFMTTAVLLRQE